MNPAEAPAAIEFSRFLVVPQHRQVLAEGRALELGGRAFDVLMALIEGSGGPNLSAAQGLWSGPRVDPHGRYARLPIYRRDPKDFDTA
jgi:hypothetical protein